MNKIYLCFLILFSAFFLSGCTNSNPEPVYNSGIYKSYDAGASWNEKGFVAREGDRVYSISDSIVFDLSFSPFSNKVLAVSTKNNGVYISENQAESWSALRTDPLSISISSFDPKYRDSFYVAYGSKLERTSDLGEYWNNLYTDSESNITTITPDLVRLDDLYLGFENGKLLKSTTYGKNWKKIYEFDSAIKDIYLASSSDIYVLLKNNEIYYSNNRAHSDEFEVFDPGFDPINILEIEFNSDYSKMYIIDGSDIYYSYNNGNSFDSLNLLNANEKYIDDFDINLKNPNVMYYSIGNMIYKTSDGGNTWTSSTTNSTSKIQKILSDPFNPNVIYIGFSNLRVIKQTSFFCDFFGFAFPYACE
ncbi:hypothetical protein K9M42_02685 [Patescibacteria group bacterium]|nr:hypothetical protein [Patescibacteria group bacterium]